MATDAPIYDRIGRGYSGTRRSDPRFEAAIRRALGDAKSVVNVGAGTGSYEPADRRVVAVEPSSEMIAQRAAAAAPAVRAVAGGLPFADDTFDAALATLTVHHWPDADSGLRGLARVARERVVVFTFDPRKSAAFWLAADYFPEIAAFDKLSMPPLERVASALGGDVEIEIVPVPHDCEDGFLGAYWRRPHAYLDPNVRAGISGFALMDDVGPGVAKLAADLEDGTWQRRHGQLLGQDAHDVGYRLVVARLR